MSALLPSDDEVLMLIHSINPGTFRHQREIGDLYGWAERTRLALIAAWNRRTAPVGAWSREDRPHPAYALAAKICRDRAKYYDDTKGHVDRDQIARSYRATADEIERLDLTPEGLSVVIHDALPSQEDVARVIDPDVWRDDLPIPTRAATEDFHARRQASCATAAAILTLMVQTGDGWLPIESAPKDGTPVDLWVFWPEHDKSRREPDAFWNSDASEWQFGEFHAGQFVHRPVPTHYRPIPAPPAKEGR